MDLSALPQTSPLIGPELAEQLRGILAKLEQPLTLRALLDEGEKSLELAGFLNHVAALCPQKLQCSFALPGTDPTLDRALDARWLPAVGLWRGQEFCRVVFHGIPGGKEINSFVLALYNAAGPGKPLDAAAQKAIAKIKKPVQAMILVSLGCHHCAQLVTDCQRAALENPAVTAHMVDANLYPDLVERYKIQRVPLLVLNETQQLAGGRELADLCYALAHAK